MRARDETDRAGERAHLRQVAPVWAAACVQYLGANDLLDNVVESLDDTLSAVLLPKLGSGLRFRIGQGGRTLAARFTPIDDSLDLLLSKTSDGLVQRLFVIGRGLEPVGALCLADVCDHAVLQFNHGDVGLLADA